MPKDIATLFTSLGLSASETKIYLASLELGPTSVQDIAKAAKLSRTAAYDAIESLQKRGLMSSFERAKKKFFTAEDPETAAAHFKENINQMQDQLEVLNRAIPEIKMMAGGERPTVRFYEGKEALYALFADVEKVSPNELLEVSNVDAVYEFLGPDDLAAARSASKVETTKVRMLHLGEIRNPRKNTKYCKISKEFGDFNGDIWVYGDRVAFVTFVGKTICVIIESKVVVQVFHVLFEAAWKYNKGK